MVADKQMAYGDSFGQSHKVLAVLYPGGVTPEKMIDFLTLVRVIDKLFRIANEKDAFGEDPWRDIAGYAILEAARGRRGKKQGGRSGKKIKTAGNGRHR